MHKALSWDDARILLEVVRHGTQGAASKALGVDQATVSRRLLRLEDVIGTPLFLRDGTRLIPTDLARRMAEQAESAESALASVFAMEAEGRPEGVVRITATPMINVEVDRDIAYRAKTHTLVAVARCEAKTFRPATKSRFEFWGARAGARVVAPGTARRT